jgi:acyl-CoA thioesterase-1
MSNVSRAMNVCLTVSAFAAAASCGGDRLPTAPQRQGPAASTGQIVVLGDSLAVSPSIPESFPARLQDFLDAAGHRWTVSNAGVSGDTTSRGLARFASVVREDSDILVLELGANDGLRGVELATIERNLSQMIERAQAMGIEVLLCGMETPPTHGLEYTAKFHQLFPALAARHRVPLVPFLLSGVVLNPDLNGDDGIHPNAAGARRIAETVWPHLESLVRADTRVMDAP